MSEIARRRVAALLLVLTIGVGALAIGDVGPFEDPPTVEEVVADATLDFFAAASEGDAARFCELLTEEARTSLRQQVASLLGENDPPGCEAGFEIVRSTLEGSELTIRYVSVSGNQARVEGRFRADGEGARPRTIELVEEDGIWRVSDPG